MTSSGNYTVQGRNVRVNVNKDLIKRTSEQIGQQMREVGRSAQGAAESLQRAALGSYEGRVERMVAQAGRHLDYDVILEIVNEVTRQSVIEDLDEDATLGRMRTALRRAEDQVAHGVTFDTDENVAEMDVMEFTKRVTPLTADGWSEAVQMFVKWRDYRSLSERLATARSGGRITVKVRAKEDGTGRVALSVHQDEVAVSILTGLPVRFIVEPIKDERTERSRVSFLRQSLARNTTS